MPDFHAASEATITGDLTPGDTVTVAFSHGGRIECRVEAVDGGKATLRWLPDVPMSCISLEPGEDCP